MAMQKRDGVERVPFTLRVRPSTRKSIKRFALEYDTNPGQVIDVVMTHSDAIDKWMSHAAAMNEGGE